MKVYNQKAVVAKIELSLAHQAKILDSYLHLRIKIIIVVQIQLNNKVRQKS